MTYVCACDMYVLVWSSWGILFMCFLIMHLRFYVDESYFRLNMASGQCTAELSFRQSQRHESDSGATKCFGFPTIQF